MSIEAQKQKQLVIDEIKEKLEKAKAAVVIDYIGITVSEADAMRKKLREANVDYTVYKNTLVKRAIAGTQYEQLAEILDGPSAFAFSYEDPALPAKTLNNIIKEYKKMHFKAGVVEGTFYDAAGIEQIASIPSREELIAKFMGSIQSPVSKLVRTFQAVADAKGAGTDAAPAAPAAEVAKEEPAAEAPAAEAVEAEAVATETTAEEVAAEATEAPAEVEAEATEAVATEATAEGAAEEAPAVEAEATEAAPEAEEAAKTE